MSAEYAGIDAELEMDSGAGEKEAPEEEDEDVMLSLRRPSTEG